MTPKSLVVPYRPIARACRVALATSMALALLGVGKARGDELDVKRRCAGAHEQTQRLRLAGKLREARASAITCAQEVCPALVRVECATLLSELEATVPSVIVEVREPSGERLSDVSVSIDGVSASEVRDGKPVALDPGDHVVRAVAVDGRGVEVRVALLEGEVRRRILLHLPPPAPPQHVNPGPVRPPTERADQASVASLASPRVSKPWWPVYALGGVGVGGLGTFAIFGLSGYREQVALESTCAPACAPGSDTAMRRNYLVADIGLAVSVVALVGAVWFALRSDGAPRVPASW